MNIPHALRLLFEKAIITPEQLSILQDEEEKRPVFIHWEIRVVLLAGISFLSTGLGILIYKNIDTIGHQAIIALIVMAIIGCGWYVYKNRQPFLVSQAQKEQPLADNLLLLGCSFFLILEGYLQYQYQLFGTRYGLATLIPTLIFFYCAYRFDHIGVLTMALTAFVSWAGLTVTPLSIFREDVFHGEAYLIYTGIAVGVIFMISGLLLHKKQIKPHFTFSYLSLGFNLACIAALYGCFEINQTIFSILCMVLSALGILYARREQSYFFLLAGIIYGYIAFTTLISQIHLSFEIWMLYGVITCFGIVMFFLNYKKLLK